MMLMIQCYVPTDYAETLKSALFAAGAGTLGNYRQCCWQTLGQGQFFAGEDTNPAYGKPGTCEYVSEIKLEMICDNDVINDVIHAMHEHHPYETPAYAYWPINQHLSP